MTSTAESPDEERRAANSSSETEAPAPKPLPPLKTILVYCLPALLIGLALRAALWVKMPSAFYHPDSEQVFDTCRSLLHGTLHFHGKKTPIGPLLYCLPSLLHLPVMPTVALVQHLLGLGLVALIGVLAAWSLTRWRVFIVPITIAVAISPPLLWYEHVALPETMYVCSLAALALAALYYSREPSWRAWLYLAAALFCTAGLRPEGKLFFLFGLSLVVWANWKRWRHLLQATAATAALMALCLVLDRTSQSGSLLYSNVVHLTPEHLYSAPGFAEQHRDYFQSMRKRWALSPTGHIARERRTLLNWARDYLKQTKGMKTVSDPYVERFCGKLGMEVCLRNIAIMPLFALTKFRFTLRNEIADDFGPDFLYRKQASAVARNVDDSEDSARPAGAEATFTRIVYGRDFKSREELDAFLRETYRPFSPDWLTSWQNAYAAGILAVSLPDREAPGGVRLPGMPLLYLAAAAGLIALALRQRPLAGYYLLWLGMLVFLAFVLTLTGSNLGRFRIGFEPFWVLYACGLFDALLGGWRTRPA
jgi:hypothetical protein